MKIPFNKPSIVGDEFQNIKDAITEMHISGDGKYTKKSQELLENLLKVPKVLLTTSCTHALEMAAMLLNVGEGDEVVLPSFTYVSVCNAFVLRGAIPKFIDIRPDTLNMDEKKLVSLISPRTKCIVPVHYAGVGCEMETIIQIGKESGTQIVEDNAHGLFGKYCQKPLGTFGSLGALSFHETKNFTCGEGGALLINDPQMIERAEIIREKGTNRTQFFKGRVDKYTWLDYGSSYLPSDILAAFLYAQLESRVKIQNLRKNVWTFYHEELKDWAKSLGIGLPKIPEHCDHPYHSYYLIMNSNEERQALIKYLESHEIQSVFHYLPLHLSPMGRKYGGKNGDCPVTEDLSKRLLRLPFYNELSQSQLSYVTSKIKGFRS
ncbi:MAG: dTDP-4-amino-4,6-dideoxygalactose transaminase [Salegentibacter mishustinae]|nr:dTDP-4-amino-4,6-dideoxygalactose transaminase [Salegentibacter mishustinae]